MIRRSLSLIVICAVATLLWSLEAQTTSPGSPPASQEQVWPPAGVVRACQCERDPVLVKDKKPHYTKAAMSARIQGTVEMEAVVETNGKVGEVRVVRSLDKDYGLDDEAVKAVKQWKFKPLTAKDGNAVPVLVQMEISFWLHR